MEVLVLVYLSEMLFLASIPLRQAWPTKCTVYLQNLMRRGNGVLQVSSRTTSVLQNGAPFLKVFFSAAFSFLQGKCPPYQRSGLFT